MFNAWNYQMEISKTYLKVTADTDKVLQLLHWNTNVIYLRENLLYNYYIYLSRKILDGAVRYI